MADNKLSVNRNALAGTVDPSLSLMGGTVDKRAMEIYARILPFLAPLLDDPQKLMSFIDTVHKRESQSRGTPDLWPAIRANDALKYIYGINDYTPQGFLKYTNEPTMEQTRTGREAYSETGGWTNPRPFPK